MTYYLPTRIEETLEKRLRKKTGIEKRHISKTDEKASDMAVFAAEKLFSKGVDRKSIDYILFCTQSPDYFLPTTACILQHRLQLSKECGALDFNLGCSGYIYGLGLAKGLIETGQAENILLLTSETYSKYIHPKDMAVRPLFGDAAAATLISGIDTDVEGIYALTYGTNGDGYDKLIVPAGGAAMPFGIVKRENVIDEFGNERSNYNLYMDGTAIMMFALDVVPKCVDAVLCKAKISRKKIDYCVFHQANRLILNFLREKCGLNECNFWNDVANYGNTVSSSIPIAMVDLLKSVENSQSVMEKVLLCGFGVGLSWGGCMVDLHFVNEDISMK